MKNKCWNVLIENVNANRIESYDIFSHGGFLSSYKKLLKRGLLKREFSEELERIVKYYFWSKCEWEILVSGWPPTKDSKETTKIDVYRQLALNWNIFVDYCFEIKEIRHRKSNSVTYTGSYEALAEQVDD